MWILPEVALQKIIAHGIKELRKDRATFNKIFCQFTQDELSADYGEKYRDDLWNWYSTTKIPVVRAWQMNVQNIPCFSIRLASETEDVDKAAFSDMAGYFGGDADTDTAVFTTMLDIGIHASKSGDHVLWMYYILSYILFKHKLMAHRFGLKLQTYSASDYNKEASKMAENVWTRWVRFRCTTQNFWSGEEAVEIEDVNFDPAVGIEPPAWDIAATPDVDICALDGQSNDGIRFQSTISTDEDDLV